MKLLQYNEARLQPNVCMLCEQFHGEDAKVNYVDVLQDFECAVNTPITGRKYVCGECGGEIARVLGYTPNAEVTALENALEAAKMELEFIAAQGANHDELVSLGKALLGTFGPAGLAASVNAPKSATVRKPRVAAG